MSVTSSETVHSRTDVVVYPTELELSEDHFTFQAPKGVLLSDYLALATAFRRLSPKQSVSGFLNTHAAFDAAFLGFRKLAQGGETRAEEARNRLRADDEQVLQSAITDFKNLGARDSKLGSQTYAQVAQFHAEGTQKLASVSRDMQLVTVLSAQLRDGLRDETVSLETLARTLDHRSSCLLSAAKNLRQVKGGTLSNKDFQVHHEILSLIEASTARYPRLGSSSPTSTVTPAGFKSREPLTDRELQIRALIQTANTQWAGIVHCSAQGSTAGKHYKSLVGSLEEITAIHSWELQYQAQVMEVKGDDGVSENEAPSRASSSADSIVKKGSSRGLMGSSLGELVRGWLDRNKVKSLLEASAKNHKSAAGTTLVLPDGVPITGDLVEGGSA